MTSKNGRASFSASSAALLAVPYSVTPGESRNFDLTTSSHVVSSGSTADPVYLFSQVDEFICFHIKEHCFKSVFLLVEKCGMDSKIWS